MQDEDARLILGHLLESTTLLGKVDARQDALGVRVGKIESRFDKDDENEQTEEQRKDDAAVEERRHNGTLLVQIIVGATSLAAFLLGVWNQIHQGVPHK